MRIFFSIFMLGWLVAAQVWAENTEVNIDISRFESRKINIAVADFSDAAEAKAEKWGQKITAVVKNDLILSHYFNVTDAVEQNKKDLKVFNSYLGELNNLGVDVLIQGRVSLSKDRLQLDCYIFDVATQKQVVGLRYTTTRTSFRRMAHDFSDEIVYRYTGEKGIAHTKICFVGGRGQNRDVYIVDYDGYGLRQLTRENSLVLLPKWSPDSKKIIYTSYYDKNPDLYSINTDGTGRKMLSGFQGLNSMARFSFDGKYIAIILSKDGNPDLYLLNGSGDLTQRITNSKSIESSPSWSPSNRDLVFVSDRAGSPQLYIIDIDGVNLRRVTYNNNYNDSPDWSPTGERIAYVVRQKGEFNIFTTDINGNFQQQLTSGTGRNENPAFSPDGRFIVFVTDRNNKSELYVMNNDGSEQRPLFPSELRDQFSGEVYTPSWSQ